MNSRLLKPEDVYQMQFESICTVKKKTWGVRSKLFELVLLTLLGLVEAFQTIMIMESLDLVVF